MAKINAMIIEARTQKKSFHLILFVVCASIFMANLDTTIVNISLPTISRYFDVGTGEISWITLSYFLTVTSLLLAFLLFFLDSGGLHRIALLLALALMGIGYGMYAPPTLSIVLGQCPQKRGLASSIMMTSRDIGVIAGIALFETVFSATTQGDAAIHQASSQIIALGFHQAILLGIAASLMALVISLMIRNKAC